MDIPLYHRLDASIAKLVTYISELSVLGTSDPQNRKAITDELESLLTEVYVLEQAQTQLAAGKKEAL